MSVQTLVERFQGVHPSPEPAPIFKIGGKGTDSDTSKHSPAAIEVGYTVQVIQHTDIAGTGIFTSEVSSDSVRENIENEEASSSYTTEVHSSTAALEATEPSVDAKIDIDNEEDWSSEDSSDSDEEVQMTPGPSPYMEPADLIAILNWMRKGDLFNNTNNLPHEVVYRGTAPEAVETGDFSLWKTICEDRRCRVHFKATDGERQYDIGSFE
ncbi:hypothetical protein M409DRAFT_57641 [Zasmidium cellare ATCC 36951]|uniref:Uncharacterized protein n=1 Tax=Zasmidium cellare ATCC 36951 TaxID=1080233 RepID=A0A6A6C8J6_ZASCE|nr:uncharacterized protein M409DRAFT_57641 [Zasmidium cellare ATCC 36951]KAF2163361.1 hypothetical protein M409DRAFT_57641 [Zasmidium cellare ATCC 36951]